MKKTIAILTALLITPAINGFTLMKLNNWIIVPTFGTITLSILQAIGIVLIINFLRARIEDIKEGEFWELYYKAIGFTLGTSAMALIVGKLISLFI